MQSDKLFQFESIQELDAFIDYLDAIRDGFAKGKLTLRHGEDEIVFEPRGLVTFALEGKTKGVDRKLKIKLRWKEKPGVEDAGKEPLFIES
ncbi:amphi-Trp domain-containing protein [Desulfovibrio inopinatus]|uniref:amphi-Trp domain-containing protein n=1 Tax=Desulfovibrio inopinatus TaxID=102109 RepID=UPI000405AF36|nr:amphi-Trp domain-containing protein [Desulfovibrio inopinatus]